PIVVVEPAPDHPVFEKRGIAGLRFERASLQVLQPSAFEVAVAGVHRDDAVLDQLQQRNRVLAADDAIRRIEVYAKTRAARNAVYDFDEDVGFLSELGIVPKTVLVVILKDQRHALRHGFFAAGGDGIDGERDAVGSRNLRAT